MIAMIIKLNYSANAIIYMDNKFQTRLREVPETRENFVHWIDDLLFFEEQSIEHRENFNVLAKRINRGIH